MLSSISQFRHIGKCSWPDSQLRMLCVGGIFALFAFVGLAENALAADCYGLFRQRKFSQAADCFEKEANQLGPAEKLGSTAKLKKGRLLRNAALCLDRAANQSNSSNAAGYRTRAISVLNKYLQEKLYESGAQRSATQQMLSKFRRQIGYAELTLVTNAENAESCIEAQGFRKCHTGALWTIKLLPKTYQIVVTYPLNPPVKERKEFQAVSNTKKTIVLSPPVKKIGLLSVVTNDPKATLILKGGKLTQPITHTGALWTKQLDPGKYELMVVFPGHPPIKREFDIVEGKPEAQIFSKPGPPVLVINTTPINAQVFVDGKYSGNTSIRLKLTAGEHKIEIKRGCFQIVSQKMTLEANKEYAISEVLKRDPAFLSWRTSTQSNTGAILGWTALIAGVAIAGVGGAMYGVASGKSNDALQRRSYDFAGYQQLAGENNTFLTVGHVGIGVGAVGIGVGIGLLLASRPKTKFDIPCQVRIKEED